MKILLVDQIAKVSYKYTYSLANALYASKDLELHIVIDQKDNQEDLLCEYTRLFNTCEKNISKLSKLKNYFLSMHKVVAMVKQDYDILHTQWVIFSPLDYYYLKKIKKAGKRIVITIHDILPFNKKFYDYYFHKKIYSLADDIVLQTDYNVERFKKLFQKNKSRLHMIPHGHFMNYSSIKNKSESRKRLGIENNKFVYLFFGQIKDVKGVDVLLRAYALMLKQNQILEKDALLIIAGSVWKSDFSICEKIIHEQNLSDNLRLEVRYIPDEEVDYYYGACDICVLPYKEVYQSGVLQLTYAHKRAAIVTDIPAFAEIINSDRGFICKPNDVNSLADKLYEAYKERNKLDSMAENGYSYIENKYNWMDIAKKVNSIYNK